MKLIIGFSKPKKFKAFAWLIMKAYQTPYSHSYIKFHSDSYERNLIYHASHTMLNFMGEDVFYSESIPVKEFNLDVSDEIKKSVIQFAIDNAGKPYGVKEVFGLAIVRIAEILGFNIKNPIGFKNYVCSVLVAKILEENLNLDVPGDISDATPKRLFEYISSIENELS